MELIISEKDNAARRIADVLSGGTAEGERVGGVDVYRWGGKRCIGLAGHVVGVDFPEEYSDWNSVDPSELIHADVVKTPTKERIVNTVKRLARDADRVTIATDYDREGELIGKEAYELVREENESVPIDRVRFSSITENEITEAFRNPDDLDFDLAAAGEARQIIDLIWGAALTRFLSLSAKQYGDDFISVGRVQTPTLKLLVDREREIQAFEPDDYWEIFADLLKVGGDTPFEAQYYYLDEDDNEAERIPSESEANSVFSVLESTERAEITEVSRRTRTDRPPAPFNTTQFIRAAGAIGFSAKRAMSLAEDLYTAGYVTYPRTDNTVYPDDLDPRDLVETLAGEREFREDGRALLESDFELSPTRGEKETTDHPPIHPTGDLPEKSNLSDAEWEVYELVVRRFFATVAEPATWEHLRVTADAGGLSLKANGKRLVDPGYHDVYPYFGTDENYLPDVSEAEELDIVDAEMEAKQTQPPRRYGQSRLVETMEEMGIGTKCLTEESPVLTRNSDGEIVRRTAGELFAEGQVVLADGDTDIAVNKTGPTTVSFHEQRGRITEQEGTLVSRRPLRDDERVLGITTETGSFSVTDDHPVYLRDDDGVTVKPAAEVSPGDALLSSPGSGSDLGVEGRFPSSVTVLDVSEREYAGKVYDLSVDESAPNFAVGGGAIVHNSTRHNTIDKLYDRGYVEGDPPKPTGLAMGVVEAAEEYADLVVSEDMTAQLEADMTAIAEGEASLEEITAESREMLERVFEELEPSAEEIGEHIREALKQDKKLGPCPECGERLLLRSSRGGSHFVGCDGYPDCTFTLPLPNKGNPLVLDEACEEHGLHHVKMLAGRGTFVHGCPKCQADEAEEEEDEIIGTCPECGEEEGGELAIKRLRSGSRLVGCTRYPDCEYSLPLPRRGDMEVTDEHCEEHDLPELVVHSGDDPWELGCPICNYREYKAEQEENGGLESITGIGEKTKQKLEQAGIDGVEDLADADAEDLAENVDGVSASRIRDWQGDAEA
ncbi:MAG: DNA topoisomerase I [Halobacteriales archaeon]